MKLAGDGYERLLGPLIVYLAKLKHDNRPSRVKTTRKNNAIVEQKKHEQHRHHLSHSCTHSGKSNPTMVPRPTASNAGRSIRKVLGFVR